MRSEHVFDSIDEGKGGKGESNGDFFSGENDMSVLPASLTLFLLARFSPSLPEILRNDRVADGVASVLSENDLNFAISTDLEQLLTGRMVR